MRLGLTFAFVLAAFTACNPVTVGIPCETRDDCAPAQECMKDTGIPAGFCTKGCVIPGSTTECPAGTICTPFVGVTQVCSNTCATSADCRINYECFEFQKGKKACRPERTGQ